MNEMLTALAPRMHMVNPTLQCDGHGHRAFGRWLGHNYISLLSLGLSRCTWGQDLTGVTPGISRAGL